MHKGYLRKRATDFFQLVIAVLMCNRQGRFYDFGDDGMIKLDPTVMAMAEFQSAQAIFNAQLHIRSQLNGAIVDAFAYFREGAKKIVCLLPSAQPNSHINPIFHRWSWAFNLPDCHVISLSDPALYNADINAAWFLSGNETDNISAMAAVVRAIAMRVNVADDNIIFYGSSMGGFGALMLASCFDNAFAIAEVPQIDLKNYPVKGAISNIENHLLAGESLDSLSKRFPERTEVIARFLHSNRVPPLRIVTNAADSAFNEHIQFISDLMRLRTDVDSFGEISISVDSRNIGHKPLPTDDGIRLIQAALSGGWRSSQISNEEKLLAAKFNYKNLIEEATELASLVKYVRTAEDKQIYDRLKAVLYRAAEVNPSADWPFLKICSSTKLWTNSFNAEILQAARKAFERKQSLEAFIYICRGILYGHNNHDAELELDALLSATKDDEIANVGNIFKAIICYDRGDYSGYARFISGFLAAKSPEFNPYIAIPVSTVYAGEFPSAGSRSAAASIAGVSLRISRQRALGFKYIVSASCDENYFNEYARYLVESFSRTCGDEAILHLSVVNGDEEVLKTQVSGWGGKNVLVVSQGIDAGENSGPIASLLRFCHVDQLLDEYQIPVLVLDLDTVIKASLSAFVDSVTDCDIGSRMLKGVAPWETYTGGFAVFNVTPAAKYIAQNIAFVASEMCETGRKQWWIVQNCFEAGIRGAMVNGVTPVIKDVVGIRDKYCVMPVGSSYAKKAALDSALANL